VREGTTDVVDVYRPAIAVGVALGAVVAGRRVAERLLYPLPFAVAGSV
jgi:hypothetical protein